MPRDPPRLLDPDRERIRFKHYSIRTEQAYVDWIKRYMRFHGNRHPSALGAPDVERFLTHLAGDGGVAQSTQNQAHSALLFLYREVLLQDMPWQQLPRDKAAARLPVVLTPREVACLLDALAGRHRLFAALLYGTGMRILEAARIRTLSTRCIERISRMAMVPSGYRPRSGASIRRPRANGFGNTRFPPTGFRLIRATARSGATVLRSDEAAIDRSRPVSPDEGSRSTARGP
jgi:integrase-like protein